MTSPILTLLHHIEKTLRKLGSGIRKQSLRDTKEMFERLTAFLDCLKESLPNEFREEIFGAFNGHMSYMEHFIEKKDFDYIESNFADIVEHDFPDVRRQIYSFIERGKTRKSKVTPLSNDVFVVHGKDHKSLEELKKMLKGFGLNPIILHEEASGSRTIVEKLEKYSNVGYAFVMLTPDDGLFNLAKVEETLTRIEAMALRREEEDDLFLDSFVNTLTKVARQNVILEFGYFMGLLGRDRVCCLYKGNVKLPSDMHGIVYIPFKESVNSVKTKIIKELKEAGYENLYPPSVPKP